MRGPSRSSLDLTLLPSTTHAHAIYVVSSQIPVYIYAPEEEGQFQPGRCSRWWLRQSLAALKTDLASLGTTLVLRRGPASLPALRQLAAETGATALVFNHLYDPISLVRDDEVKAGLASDGLWVQVRENGRQRKWMGKMDWNEGKAQRRLSRLFFH